MPYVLPFNYQVTGFQSVPCFYVTSPCVLTFPRCDNKPRQNNLLKGGNLLWPMASEVLAHHRGKVWQSREQLPLVARKQRGTPPLLQSVEWHCSPPGSVRPS